MPRSSRQTWPCRCSVPQATGAGARERLLGLWVADTPESLHLGEQTLPAGMIGRGGFHGGRCELGATARSQGEISAWEGTQRPSSGVISRGCWHRGAPREWWVRSCWRRHKGLGLGGLQGPTQGSRYPLLLLLVRLGAYCFSQGHCSSPSLPFYRWESGGLKWEDEATE